MTHEKPDQQTHLCDFWRCSVLAVPFAKMNHDASHDADTVETTV